MAIAKTNGLNEMPLCKMTIDDLLVEYWNWTMHVKSAEGWPSAYYAAKQLEAICSFARMKGFNLENKYPIRVSQ